MCMGSCLNIESQTDAHNGERDTSRTCSAKKDNNSCNKGSSNNVLFTNYNKTFIPAPKCMLNRKNGDGYENTLSSGTRTFDHASVSSQPSEMKNKIWKGMIKACQTTKRYLTLIRTCAPNQTCWIPINPIFSSPSRSSCCCASVEEHNTNICAHSSVQDARKTKLTSKWGPRTSTCVWGWLQDSILDSD